MIKLDIIGSKLTLIVANKDGTLQNGKTIRFSILGKETDRIINHSILEGKVIESNSVKAIIEVRLTEKQLMLYRQPEIESTSTNNNQSTLNFKDE